MRLRLTWGAMFAISAAAQVCPPASSPLLRDAQDAFDAGNGASAELPLSRLSLEWPNCASVLSLRGRRELSQHRYDQAEALSEQALRAGPEDSSALTLRGTMVAMRGRAAEARELLEHAARRDPTNAEALFQLGILFDRAKASPEAVSTFQKVVKLRPRDPRAWDYLALNLEALGQIREAEQAYQTGLAVNRQPLFDWFLDYNYGRLLLKANRLQESQVHLDHALELVPQLRATHYEHAKLNVRLGKLDEARHDAERALNIPDANGLILDLQIYNLLAGIYTRLGDHEHARQYVTLSESTRIPVRNPSR